MHTIRSFDLEPSTVTDMLLAARLIPVTPWLNDALAADGEPAGPREPGLIELGGFLPADAAASLRETGDRAPELGIRPIRSATLEELIDFSRADPDAQKQGLIFSLRGCRTPKGILYPYLGYFGPRTKEAREIQQILSPDSALDQRFIGLWHPDMPLPPGARALVIEK